MAFFSAEKSLSEVAFYLNNTIVSLQLTRYFDHGIAAKCANPASYTTDLDDMTDQLYPHVVLRRWLHF